MFRKRQRTGALQSARRSKRALRGAVLGLLIATGCATSTGTNAAAGGAQVVLENFQLTGNLSAERASFELTANARVEKAGGSIELLSGKVALTEVDPDLAGEFSVKDDAYVLTFRRKGVFPIRVRFDAAVRRSEGWNEIDFYVAPTALQRVVLAGLDADTQFRFANAAKPERVGAEFVSHLPSDGAVDLAWKETPAAAEGRLFYSAEMLSQITVSPGLMRQVALLEFRVMQGELNRVSLLLEGAGEVTRVQGDQVLAWNVEPGEGSEKRRLTVQLNQPQKDQFTLQVQMQTSLGAFPQSAGAMRLQPEDAVRFAGHVRIVNEGAVRLEVSEATGLSQIAPEQFPESDATRATFGAGGSQRFVYRFSGGAWSLGIDADQILPELFVSQILAYHLGENERFIEAEIEVDVREAPLRELLLRIPQGYIIARLQAGALNDYFLRDLPGETDAELRLVFGQPVTGRQIVQLRLERNEPVAETNWSLPRIEVVRAKSVRGFVGVSSDPGLRLTPDRTQALADVATAFFPRKIANLHAAFRLSEPAWEASVLVERLPQTIDANVLHLFSIGEAVAYGSSVMNYMISGAPIQTFHVELSTQYFNVEFTGKDIRSWERSEDGYVVQLHTPVSGAYTLLATYERPFRAQGETLAFTGARPEDAQSEKGHTIIISAHQFEARTVDVSPGLLPLEPGEVPSEYRLFFDAPILSAYRYSARPFQLELELTPLTQGNSLNQLVDRAVLESRVSKDGHVLTTARYFVKNRGHPHLRVTLPEGTELWSARVNGVRAVPVRDASAHLVPLPQNVAPDTVLTLELTLAGDAKDARRVAVSAPILGAPVMLGEWTIEPEARQRLEFRRGSLTPSSSVGGSSAIAGMARVFSGLQARTAGIRIIAFLVMAGIALVAWRWAARYGTTPGARAMFGTIVGLIAFVLALGSLFRFGRLVNDSIEGVGRTLTFLAPVQQAGNGWTVEVANVPDRLLVSDVIGFGWPVVVAVFLFGLAWLLEKRRKTLVRSDSHSTSTGAVIVLAAGWALLGWAALRLPHGGTLFASVVALALILHLGIPAIRVLRTRWRTGRQVEPEAQGGMAHSTTALILSGLIALGFASGTTARADSIAVGVASEPATNSPGVRSVRQDIRIDEQFAFATARIQWEAKRGEKLRLLEASGVPTRIDLPSRGLRLVSSGGEVAHPEVIATQSGEFSIKLEYQSRVSMNADERSLTLPVPTGLINEIDLTVINADVDVRSPQLVSVSRETVGSNTVAKLVLAPSSETRIQWRPRSRDVSRERPVFYGEFAHLLVPAAGAVEGAHHVWIRPAQGQLTELSFEVPAGMTITDVAAGLTKAPGGESIVSVWRFDPDERKLRITLNPAQSRPFDIVLRSQVGAATLPFEQRTRLPRLESAAGQLGVVGVATGSDVQLDTINAGSLSPINLEDFPQHTVSVMKGRVPDVTLRRAFRYSDGAGEIQLAASAVEPDIRVETQETLSLGEDRVLLAVTANVSITRAGIFRLSFPLPEGFSVESISGSAMSHWTESRTNSGRTITLHLPGKTQGMQQFAITLSSSGLRTTNNWQVPEVIFREASKQRGTLVVVPETGMRVLVAERGGVTQLDPERSGVRQKGVLAFRVLEAPSRLSLNVEQVDAWIQVNSLQQAMIAEGQVSVSANLNYQIENTGLRVLRVLVPTNAESVRFEGAQVADFMPLQGAVTNGLQEWEIKLHRRTIGSYLLQVSYQISMPRETTTVVLRGVQSGDANVQRGFVTLQSDPRLQLSPAVIPAALQPSEWQAIPRALLRNASSATAALTYRLAAPGFELPLQLARHEAARLLPARVENVTLNSVVSDNALTLTQVRMEIVPGDKRLLEFTLPEGARFWFAFVNRNGVWPWREGERILVPLEQQSRGDKPVIVELFYDRESGDRTGRSLDLTLLAPQFDLPLEDITWRVSMSGKWKITDSSGDLEFEGEQVAHVAVDLPAYLQQETLLQQERTAEAERWMTEANQALERGDPQAARRAFQAAYGLSFHDSAFNEDARVQLHNLKLQQALVGLSVVRGAADVNTDAAAGGVIRYTQQDARDLLDRNTADENAAFMKLAERMIQQQDAAIVSASALRATLPEQERVWIFKRAVLVDEMAGLNLKIEAAPRIASLTAMRFGALAGVFFLVLVVVLFSRRIAVESPQATP